MVRSVSSIFGGLGSYVNDMSNRFEVLVFPIRSPKSESMDGRVRAIHLCAHIS